ncbi:hypothetical protein YC2023_098232 [Brassica napus]|uniref:(rape) hypothetical protein n=1 Tax=Brassica napus TaxID=3708 RepID=A0A816TVS1_BRANA|nr:unnamed protein product [Brassica napus]
MLFSALVGIALGSPLLSRCVYRWVSLYHGGESCALSTHEHWCSSSDRLTGDDLHYGVSRGSSYSPFLCKRRFLAATVSTRRLSVSTSDAAVLVSMTAAFRRLVIAHIPTSLGSLELLVVVCVQLCACLGSGQGVRRLRPVLLGSATCTC